MGPEVVVADRVVKVYGAGKNQLEVLRGVNLRANRGELLAILGRSGSGTSTLLHILGGLDRPDTGCVLVDSTDLASLDNDAMADLRLQKIGFIFQFFNLLPGLTLKANVEMPLMLANVPGKESSPRVEEMLRFVGLDRRGDHYPSELSGGEQQRGAIARALISRPRVVMADEPTGNLDSDTGRRIIELLGRMQSELDQTTIIVTHDPEIASSADRVLRLEGGMLYEGGDP